MVENARLGCLISHIFCGAVGYADDVILLAPTIFSLCLIYVDFRESLHHNITLVFNAHQLNVEREILLHNLSDLNQAIENDLNIEGFDNEMIYAMNTNILIG